MLDVNDIAKRLPHRYPMLLVDRVIEMEAGKSIHAIKNVTINEEFFQGHFPGEPIMPGVLIVEALAQAAGICAINDPDQNLLVLFRAIDKVKFRKQVVPGDQLHLYVTLLKQRRQLWIFHGKAMVDGKVVTEAEMSAVVTEKPND